MLTRREQIFVYEAKYQKWRKVTHENKNVVFRQSSKRGGIRSRWVWRPKIQERHSRRVLNLEAKLLFISRWIILEAKIAVQLFHFWEQGEHAENFISLVQSTLMECNLLRIAFLGEEKKISWKALVLKFR